jgi:hypothetical protein
MGQIQIVIEGRTESLPEGMVGSHAVVELCNRLGRDASGLSLRRLSTGTYVGETQPLGDVVHDGDELELVSSPGLAAW